MTEPQSKPRHRKDRSTKTCNAVATAAIAGIAGGSLFVMGLMALRGDDAASTQVGTVLTLAVGALVALSGGGRQNGNGTPPKE